MGQNSNTTKTPQDKNKLSESHQSDFHRNASQSKTEIVRGSATPSSTDDGIGGSGSEAKDTFIDASHSGNQSRK
jgi:hypothetical protein